jgi:hypothetical protein
MPVWPVAAVALYRSRLDHLMKGWFVNAECDESTKAMVKHVALTEIIY